MLEARAAVKRLFAYHPPLGGRRGLRLDFNESTIGCAPRVMARLRSLDAELLAKYPDREPVEAQVASFLGCDAGQVLLTNGIDEAIHLLCSTYLEDGDEAIVVVPTFAMYGIFACAQGAKVVKVRANDDFEFPLEELLSRVTSRTRLVAVANPNNPTGIAVACDLLVQVAKAAPHAAVLVDEAYFEFHGETVIEQTGRLPNLFVARTFSKAYGLAGLRIGVLAGPAEQMHVVRRVTSPYNVNAVALGVLTEALADQDYVNNYAVEVRRNRALLQRELGNLGVHYWPSSANFVLVRVGEAHEDFVRALRVRGILVRDRNSDPGCEGCVRVTVGSADHTAILVAALREVIAELAVRREIRA